MTLFKVLTNKLLKAAFLVFPIDRYYKILMNMQ